jgi:hypothetical protein
MRVCDDARTEEMTMSEASPAQPTAPPQAMPLLVNIQYVKDMSFELPTRRGF